jgi:Matrixin
MKKLFNIQNRLFLFTLSCATVMASIPLQTQAFTLVRSGSGKTVGGWGSSSITFDIDTSCNSYQSATTTAIDSAVAVWNAVPASAVEVSRGSSTTLPNPITTYVGASATSAAPKGNAIVYCDSAFSTNSGQSANSIPGFATGQNIATNGTIDGCLLVLNVQSGGAANITTLDPKLVSTILAHEIGHCLGIGHSSDTEALMYYSTSVGRGPYLARDDIDAITYLYPQQEVTTSFPACTPPASAATVGGGALPPKPGGKNGTVLSMLISQYWGLGAVIFLFVCWRRRRHVRPENFSF